MAGAPVVVLAGGTGGAKLARGMLDVVGEDLVVVANTADDVEAYGAYVCPDPDLVAYWLADRIDARGWGLRDDTFNVMGTLKELGGEEGAWFTLGDRDLAVGLDRQRRLDAGERLTDTLRALTTALGIAATVLPMSDDRVRTRVRHGDCWFGLQEYLVRAGAPKPVEAVQIDGAQSAAPTPDVLAAVAGARAIVIGPSNPIISIGPILALDGMRESLRAAPAAVVAVSPIVGSEVLKGPTAAFMQAAGHACSAAGVADCYSGLIDGMVADEPVEGIALLRCDTLMDSAQSRWRVASETLRFAEGLGG